MTPVALVKSLKKVVLNVQSVMLEKLVRHVQLASKASSERQERMQKVALCAQLANLPNQAAQSAERASQDSMATKRAVVARFAHLVCLARLDLFPQFVKCAQVGGRLKNPPPPVQVVRLGSTVLIQGCHLAKIALRENIKILVCSKFARNVLSTHTLLQRANRPRQIVKHAQAIKPPVW